MTTRTLILGDWSRWIRDPIDVLRALWEIWEWVSDHTLGSHLQLGLGDTVGDLVADTAGSLAGAALLVCWARYGWGSVRRIPGQNQYEDTEAG